MHKASLTLLIQITFLSLFFLSCTGTRLYPEPAVEIQQVRDMLDVEHPQPKRMRLTAKVDYVDGKEKKRVVGRDFVISAEQPQHLRITLSSFDKALSTLVTDGEHLLLIDAMQNVFVIGRATAENLSKLLPIYLSAHDINRTLSGSFPKDGLIENAEEQSALRWNPSENGYERSLKRQDGSEQKVFYRYPSGEIFKVTISMAEEVQYLFEASDFANYSFGDDQSIRLPKTIVFKMKAEKTDLRLRIEDYKLDPEFSAGVFKLIPPSGYDIVLLDIEENLETKSAPTTEPQNSDHSLPNNPNEKEIEHDSSL